MVSIVGWDKDVHWERVVSGVSVSGRIETYIEDLIRTERLEPGSRLPSERELATRLGVSRPSLREAVRSLKAKGLLTIRHGQGVFVARPIVESALMSQVSERELTLTELFAMREIIEVPATEWAAENANPQFLKGIREHLEELNSVSFAGIDLLGIARLDAQFHMTIVEAAGNRFLNQTLGVLQTLLETGMESTLDVPGRINKSQEEHLAILSALESGDTAAAGLAAKVHIQGARCAALARVSI